MAKILIINGPNLNLLGQREKIYGELSLDQIKDHTKEKLKNLNQKVQLEWFQTNSEAAFVDKIQESINKDYLGLIINPGALSHTSISIHDALLCAPFPIVEVHLTNTHKREIFRSQRVTCKAVKAILEGLGKDVYYLGVLALT